MANELQPWVRRTLRRPARTELAVGFSKSGIGGEDLILKHPDRFTLVASWDFPADMSTANEYGGAGTTTGPKRTSRRTIDSRRPSSRRTRHRSRPITGSGSVDTIFFQAGCRRLRRAADVRRNPTHAGPDAGRAAPLGRRMGRRRARRARSGQHQLPLTTPTDERVMPNGTSFLPCLRQHCRATSSSTSGTSRRRTSFPWPTTPGPTPCTRSRCGFARRAASRNSSPTRRCPRSRVRSNRPRSRRRLRDAVELVAAAGYFPAGATVAEYASPHGGSWLELLSRRGLVPA